MPLGRPALPMPERFWSRLERTEGCWLWKGTRNGAGYGLFMVERRRCTGAHRMAWELTNGLIPAGLLVLHKCDNPPCCNPNHLFLGTYLDNTKDMQTKERGHSGPNEFRPRVRKLTVADVHSIRHLFGLGHSMKSIAKQFNIAPHYASRVARGKVKTYIDS